MDRRIIGGFGIVILLMTIMGGAAVFTALRVGATSQKIYVHPFTVSNAARGINIHLLSIQRDMKNILLLHDRGQVEDIVDRMERRDREINEGFQVLFERYLGDAADVHQLYQAFVEWKAVRQKVANLVAADRIDEAVHLAVTQSADQIERMNESAARLITFATKRADELQRGARREQRVLIILIMSLLPVAVFISLLIAGYSVKNLRSSQRELARHLHLVDQNVLVCSLDEEGCVQDISSALCRLLGLTREEIINKESNFFVEEGDKRLLEHIRRTLKSGKEWDGIFRRMDGEGNTLWLHSRIYPVFDQAYAISGYSNIIENITSKKAIEELSLTDGLTGLHNRRYYEETIGQIIKTARREEKHLTLAILDIDFFKNYNDNYGHPAGDRVLSEIARVFRRLLHRPTDHCMRVGGEEFCIIFTGSDRKKSIEFLEEIRGEVAALKIKHEYSDVHPYVTVSAGAVVSFGRDVPQKEQLYRQADEALYQAKKERNKLVVI